MGVRHVETATVDAVNGYTCDCDEDHELMLLINGSVCVAKECGISSRTRLSGTDVNVNVKVRQCRGSSEKMNSQSGRVHECRSRVCDVTGAIQVA